MLDRIGKQAYVKAIEKLGLTFVHALNDQRFHSAILVEEFWCCAKHNPDQWPRAPGQLRYMAAKLSTQIWMDHELDEYQSANTELSEDT